MDNNNQESTLVAGMFFNQKHENAPDFVLGSVSFKVDDVVAFLQQHKNEKGYVNVDFLRAKPKEGEAKGKPYFKLNTFVPDKDKNAPQANSAPSTAPVNAGEDTRDVPEITGEDVPW